MKSNIDKSCYFSVNIFSQGLGDQMAILKSACIMLAFMLVGGCANVDVQRVTSYDQHGVRYWRPAPYVAVGPVAANGTTTCQASIVMLPDKSEEYAITMNTGLWGTASASPTLQDGWNLTGLNASADSKTAEVLGSIASILNTSPFKAHVAGATKSSTPACAQGLYRVDFDKYGRVSGLTHVSAFSFTSSTSKPPVDDESGKKK